MHSKVAIARICAIATQPGCKKRRCSGGGIASQSARCQPSQVRRQGAMGASGGPGESRSASTLLAIHPKAISAATSHPLARTTLLPRVHTFGDRSRKAASLSVQSEGNATAGPGTGQPRERLLKS